MVKECEKTVAEPIYVVTGGPHAKVYPQELAGMKSIDFVLS